RVTGFRETRQTAISGFGCGASLKSRPEGRLQSGSPAVKTLPKYFGDDGCREHLRWWAIIDLKSIRAQHDLGSWRVMSVIGMLQQSCEAGFPAGQIWANTVKAFVANQNLVVTVDTSRLVGL